jgi:hypothetical protein
MYNNAERLQLFGINLERERERDFNVETGGNLLGKIYF